MRILLLGDYYQQYLNAFYEKNETDGLSYDEHLELLLDDYFGSFGSYCRHFRKLGHTAELIIGNDTRLQKKWLQLKGIKEDLSKSDVVLSQVEEFGPDVFFTTGFAYYGTFLSKVSSITKNIFCWIACPYPADLDHTNTTCIISSAKNFVERFRAEGLRSEFLRAAFDADLLSKLDNRKTIDISFIGSLSSVNHGRRVDGLKYLLKKGINLKLFGYGLDKKTRFPFFQDVLKKNYQGELWGINMYKALNQSKISLNFYVDVWNKSGANMRTYEATGCGSLLLTEKSSDIEEYFSLEKEVDAFASLDELVEKASYYLSHESVLRSVTEAGQKACIARHGYDKRIKEFEKIIFKYSS